ncbi:MAG TPA: DUF1573 domain-containing protein [Bacteroidetes bacterium]|nr:DUF1573 domain-containing protein [Bacteroidota bacterium]
MKFLNFFTFLMLSLAVFQSCTDSENQQKNPASVSNRTYDAPKPKIAPAPKAAPKGFQASPGQQTVIHFSHLGMEFGPVISGDTVHAVYPFKNMSLGTVVITEVATSCECLKTEFPHGNIQPGEIGEIKAHFHTEGQWGRHEKIISVVVEGQDPIPLRLNGEIRKAG